MAIGIRWAVVTYGMRVIGLGLHMKELAGLRRITMALSTSQVIGTAIAAMSSTITAGTTTMIATLVAATTITTTTIDDHGRDDRDH